MKTRILFTLTLALAALLFAPAVQAQVNSTVDELDGSCGDGDCSLRDAVALAPAFSNISVLPGTYVLTLGQITIDKDLAITALFDPRTTIIDGNNASRTGGNFAESGLLGDHSHKSGGTDNLLGLLCGSHFPTPQCDLQCDASVIVCP